MIKFNRNIIIIMSAVFIFLAIICIIALRGKLSVKDSLLSDTEPLYMIYSEDTSNLSSVSVEYSNVTITAYNNGNSEWSIDAVNDDIDKSKAYTLASTVSTIISKNKIEENPKDLSKYGLDTPSVTVIITENNGTQKKLYIGNKSSETDEYYMMLDGDNSVYTLYNYKYETLTQPLSYYSDFNRFKIEVDDITEINIEHSGECINLRAAKTSPQIADKEWEITEPYKNRANSEYIELNILSSLKELNLNEPVLQEGDYGFDAPVAKVTLTVRPYNNTTGKYGNEYKEILVIGKVSGETAYVRYKDKVYQVENDQVAFAEVSAFDILNKLQALTDISLLKSITLISDNRNDKIEITDSGEDMSFRLNGKEADYILTKNMYQSMVSLAVDDIYHGESLGDAILCFEFEGIKKSDNVKIEFREINDSSCALLRNGQAEFTIQKYKLDNFNEAWSGYIEAAAGKEGTNE